MILSVDTNKDSAEDMRRAAKLLQELAQLKDGGNLAEEIEEVSEVADLMTSPVEKQQPPRPPVEPQKKSSLAGGIQVY